MNVKVVVDVNVDINKVKIQSIFLEHILSLEVEKIKMVINKIYDLII